jgi:serine protease Do
MPNPREANAGKEQEGSALTPHLGLSVAPAGEVAGAGAKGVVVTKVDPDGPAAEHGFKSGDVILSVGGNSVSNVTELRKALADAKSAGKHQVLMQVKTADNTHFVAMPIG